MSSYGRAAKEGRPDCAAAASLGAASFPKPTIQNILDVNRAVKTLKDRPELSINIRAVSVDKLAWGVVSDASFANAYMVVTVRAPTALWPFTRTSRRAAEFLARLFHGEAGGFRRS